MILPLCVRYGWPSLGADREVSSTVSTVTALIDTYGADVIKLPITGASPSQLGTASQV